MRKFLNIFVLVSFLSGAGLAASTWSGVSPAWGKNPPPGSSGPSSGTKKKRCERCHRGPDGKMVCQEVPCPK